MSDSATLVPEPATRPVRVLHVDDEESFAELAATFLERENDAFEVETATTGAAALDRLAAGDVDCVISDYAMPRMDGLELLEAVREAHGDLPFVLLTGKGGEAVAAEAVSAGVTEYFRKESGTEQYAVLANRIAGVVESSRRRIEIETLNRINTLVQEIIRGLVAAATREAIETTVCAELAASSLYRFAWIGEPAVGGGGGIVPRTASGADEGYLDAITDAEGRLVESGPAAAAIDAGEIRSVRNLATDPAVPERVREDATERGYRSLVAVPLTRGSVVYGVLVVYADRPDAFGDRERAGFAALGETVGFAINASKQERLLLSDSVVELEFDVVDERAFLVDLARGLDCTCSLNGIVPGAAGTLLYYVTVDDAPTEAILERAAATEAVAGARLVGESDDEEADREATFELVLAESPFGTLIEVGASVQFARVEEGVMRLGAEVSADADIRAVVAALGNAYEGTELRAKRNVDRPVQTAQEFRKTINDHLTEKQHRALRAAYFAGYFEWPRGSTAEEVATAMSVSSPTLHNHLRKAQRKLLAEFFTGRFQQ
jgi:CheY-like chemotaxis protein